MNNGFQWIARNPIKFGILAFLFGLLVLALEAEIVAQVVKSVFPR